MHAQKARLPKGFGPVLTVVSSARNSEQLLVGAAQMLYADGDLRRSREWFDEAYHAAEGEGDAAAMALAALGIGGLWVAEHRSTSSSLLLEGRLRHALAQADLDPRIVLRLRARLAAETDYRAGTFDAILAVVAEARRTGDPLATAEAISLAHHCLLGPEHGGLRDELAREMITIGVHTSRRSDHLLGLLWHTVDMFLAGDPHAERSLAELRSLLERNKNLAVAYVIDAIDVMLTTRAGYLQQAEEMATACAERGALAGDADAAGWHGAHMIAIRWYQGRIAELMPLLQELVNSPTLSAVDNSHLSALAVAAATAGDERLAASALARLQRLDLAKLARSSSWLVTMYGIVECADLLHDTDVATSAYDLMLPFADLPMVASIGVTCFGSVHHALGVAAVTIGKNDLAVDHFRASVEANLAIGNWPAATLSRARLAQALMTKGTSVDVSEAEAIFAVAAHSAAELGMRLPLELDPGLRGDRESKVTPVTCHRIGRRWEVKLARRTALVEDSVGMMYLATLLANPGFEIPALELVAGADAVGKAALEFGSGPEQPVLDEAARRAYRARLSELQAEIAHYEAMNDLARAERLREEHDWLVGELSAAAGLGGRIRSFAGNAERARISVGKAIRRALDRIGAIEPSVAEELRATITTGRRCCYRPR